MQVTKRMNRVRKGLKVGGGKKKAERGKKGGRKRIMTGCRKMKIRKERKEGKKKKRRRKLRGE